MTTGYGAEADPSVCYRHPGRQSWVLCQRCGRTICPECQILAPVGVQCPECVREAGGSVTWTPTSGSRAKRATGQRRGGAMQRYLAAESGPHVSWIVVGVSTVLWVLGFVTGNLPSALLISGTGAPWQLWRFLTSWLVTPAIPLGISILSFVVNMVLFAWFGPYVERMLGRARFLLVLVAGAVFGGAIGVLSGGVSYGLTPGLYAVLLMYGILAARSGMNPLLLWVLMGVNVLYTAVGTPSALPQLIGGLLAGLGMWALEEHGGRFRGPARLALIWGVVALSVALATLRLIATSA